MYVLCKHKILKKTNKFISTEMIWALFIKYNLCFHKCQVVFKTVSLHHINAVEKSDQLQNIISKQYIKKPYFLKHFVLFWVKSNVSVVSASLRKWFKNRVLNGVWVVWYWLLYRIGDHFSCVTRYSASWLLTGWSGGLAGLPDTRSNKFNEQNIKHYSLN
jgi:hypothetical protein